jgi:PAS domain S-box-containing protein
MRSDEHTNAKVRPRLEQLEALAAASVSIAAAHSTAATLQEVADQARLIIGAHLAATHSVSQRNWNAASVAVSLSEKYARFASFKITPNGSGIYRRVIEEQRPLRLTSAELTAHEAWRDLSGHTGQHPPLCGLLAVPMTSKDGRSIGVIMLSDKADGEFTAEDEAMLAQLAQIASVTIQNAQATEALRHSEERLRATQEHANIAICEVDATGRFMSVNASFSALTGYPAEELLHLSFFDLTHEGDLERERDLYGRQLAGEVEAYSIEKRYVRKDGTVTWVAVAASAVFDPQGRFRYGIRVLQDVSERKRAGERQQLLLRELHHRVRNNLATVQALLGATGRAAATIDEFRDAFLARIIALGNTHTLLTDDYWPTASLADMLKREIAPFDDPNSQRITLHGPPIQLSVDLAVPVGMAVHELASNAVKHGALSVESGRVTVSWAVANKHNRRTLHLEWVETGGPPLRTPGDKGFGSTLLQRVLPKQCNAEVQLEFEEAGVRFRLRAPLAEQRSVPPH